MPWTFAHPAAILPLRSLCPRWLSFPALILGAMAPDISYYVGMHGQWRTFCHTPEGILMNVVVGIVGAFIGGWLLSPYFGGGTINAQDFSLPSLIVSLLGAIILLAVVNLLRRLR